MSSVLSLQTCFHSSCPATLPWEADLFETHQRAPLLSGFQLGLVGEQPGQTWERLGCFIPLAPSLWNLLRFSQMEGQNPSQEEPFLMTFSEFC